MTKNNQESQKDLVEKKLDNHHLQSNNQTNLLSYRLSFSKSQKRFLILSAIIPLAIFLLQIVNLVFVILNPPPGSLPQDLTFSRIVDMSTPFVIMIVMSIFGLINFIFLLNWKKKVTKYSNQKQLFKEMIASDPSESDDTEFISFTQLAYQNLRHMKRMRTFLFITSIVCVLYIWWAIRGFLMGIGVIIPKIPIHRPPLVLHIINITAQVVLIIYFILQWMFFFKWNKKLSKIEHFEKQTIDELEL